MSQEIMIAVIGAAGLLIAAFVSVPRIVRDIRWSIERDLSIYKALPPESEAKTKLLAKIDREIAALDMHDQRRRYPMGIGLGVAFLLMALAGAWWIVTVSGWWWWLSPIAGFALLIGIVGLAQGIPKRLRDEKGNIIDAQG